MGPMPLPTKKQMNYLSGLQRDLGISSDELFEMFGWSIEGPFGVVKQWDRVTKASVSYAIDKLKAELARRRAQVEA